VQNSIDYLLSYGTVTHLIKYVLESYFLVQHALIHLEYVTVIQRLQREGKGATAPAKHILEGAKPHSFFVEGHPELQTATLGLIITSLYSYN